MTVYNVTQEAESFTCNAYLIPNGRSSLIDVGTMNGIEEVVSDNVNDLDALFITHQHSDHVGEIESVIDRFDPEVYAYADHPLRTKKVDDGDSLSIGDETFEAVFTPGHADDHLAFISKSTIFSGDVVVHTDGAFEGGSFGRTDRPGQSRERLIESIQLILERLPESVEHMYPGHGIEYHGDVKKIIETALARAERREPKYTP